MPKLIPYETIEACKKGNEEALAAILKHYEPLIVEASRRFVPRPDGKFDTVVDEDVKAYIESELAMKIMFKYDLSRTPPKKASSKDASEDKTDNSK